MATSDYALFKQMERVVSCDEFAASQGLAPSDWQENARIYFDLAQDVFIAYPENANAAEMACVAAAMQRALAGTPDPDARYTDSFSLGADLALTR